MVPGRVRICLLGFAPAKSLDLTIVAPNGRKITGTPRTDADGIATWQLNGLPTRGMGTYRINARQGDLVAETTVEATPPIRARSLVVPERPRLGQIVRIWFGGLPPGEELPAHLFRLGDANESGCTSPDSARSRSTRRGLR